MDLRENGTGELFRISRDTKEVSRVELDVSMVESFPGGDGILFGPGGLLFLANLAPDPNLVVAEFNEDFSVAVARPAQVSSDLFSVPTTLAVQGDNLVVVNS